MSEFVQPTPWPKRLWTPARIRYGTSFLVPTLVGGFVASRRRLLANTTDRTIPNLGTMIRTLMPATLSEAARKVGLNGPMVACVLYFLIVGMVLFLGELTAH